MAGQHQLDQAAIGQGVGQQAQNWARASGAVGAEVVDDMGAGASEWERVAQCRAFYAWPPIAKVFAMGAAQSRITRRLGNSLRAWVAAHAR
jgi:hypothetical protein